MHTFVLTHERNALNLAHIRRIFVATNVVNDVEEMQPKFAYWRVTADYPDGAIRVGPTRHTAECAADDLDRLLTNIGNLIAVSEPDEERDDRGATTAGHVIRTNWLAERDDR